MDMESQFMLKTKSANKRANLELLTNGDSEKTIISQKRYLLCKSKEIQVNNQKERGQLLFGLYYETSTACHLFRQLRSVYNSNNGKNVAMLKLIHWCGKQKNPDLRTLTSYLIR